MNSTPPESEEYGIVGFVDRARRPFNSERLEVLLDECLAGMLRAKGFLRLATRHHDLILFSIAGSTIGLKP